MRSNCFFLKSKLGATMRSYCYSLNLFYNHLISNVSFCFIVNVASKHTGHS